MVSSSVKKEIARLRSNNRIIMLKRRAEVEAEIRRLYLSSEFDIPKDCIINPYTKIEDAISAYYDQYDTSNIRTVFDIDISLNNNSLSEIESLHPEYFI